MSKLNSNSHRRNCGNQFPVKGMDSVVATVTGYHGSERFDLIRMISRAGANYVGTMSRSATHLLCWKFEGKKYELAKKLGIFVVNHRWVEDCIRRGRRVPEDPYTWKSGEEVGPLLAEALHSVDVDISNKNCGALSEHSNIFDGSKDDRASTGCQKSDVADWAVSHLLNEDLFLDLKNGDKDNVRQNCKTRGRVKWDHGSSSRHFVQFEKHDGPSSSVKRSEKGKRKILECDRISSEKGKRKISECDQTSSEKRKRKISECDRISSEKGKSKISECDRISSPWEFSRKGRKLVKKTIQHDVVDLLSDSDQDNCPTRVLNTEDLMTQSDHLNELMNVLSQVDRGKSDDGCSSSRVMSGSGDEDVEEIKGSSNSVDKPSIIAERTQDESCEFDNNQRRIKDDDPVQSTGGIPSSVELSCVICWTDFSSTRGVLACGHRFCYSCIQNWADHMLLRRKVSTCPLCKATFTSIMKVEDAATSDQKIYSQTIPFAPSTKDIFILSDQDVPNLGAQYSPGAVCCKCRQSEPEDCLVSCHICHIRRIHSYCLDPPLLPWTCIHCKDLQMLYLYNR